MFPDHLLLSVYAPHVTLNRADLHTLTDLQVPGHPDPVTLTFVQGQWSVARYGICALLHYAPRTPAEARLFPTLTGNGTLTLETLL
jgi:hypothetical protein